jgi:PST family polysaccharide transporter
MVARAVRGAFWTILSGVGARVVGILGTLAVTHYLSPSEYGEASVAALVALTASVVANLGVSQYLASRPDADRVVVFHATFWYVVLGVAALFLALIFQEPIGRLVGAPALGSYLPLLAVWNVLERLCVLQDRIQLRDMRFRSVGLQRSLGELTYAGTSVLLAATCAGTPFGGGHALVWAMIARSSVRLVALFSTTAWRDWAEPHRITWARTREFLGYGLPMSVLGMANFGSQKFDNFVCSRHFGEAVVGKYNLAYNFADIPAALIAETMGDVLVPSFARMESDDRRRDAFLLALRTQVLLVAPLALGLAAVAPELVGLAFPPSYDDVTLPLRILVMFAIPRTIIWTAVSYLQVGRDPRLLGIMETARMVGIVVFMHLASVVVKAALGPEAALAAACAAVVGVFALSSFGYLVLIRQVDRVPLADQILPLLAPILACAPMVLLVHGVQRGLRQLPMFGADHAVATFAERARVFGPRLAVEVLVGAICFVPSALLLAPTVSRRLVRMVRETLEKRRRAPAA